MNRRAFLLGAAAVAVPKPAEQIFRPDTFTITGLSSPDVSIVERLRIDATPTDGTCYYHTVVIDRAMLAERYGER